MMVTIDVINKELKDLQEKKYEIEQKEVELMNKFYQLYSIPSEKHTLSVQYYGTEYLVTDVDFGEQKVFLESAPYEVDNEVVTVSFLAFDEVFREYHSYEEIEWSK
ncbi:hypothetical protein QH639_18065 [Lysinibacillus sp. 1 U-2021]|uniref:hypothetical protein n=1 Tax=Lysinibacillus sp. 1 U-2021 TaxID=3039426 RepID=UPI0024814FCA|nr:hypothetical protein [Lysinibacillus sp. 1 U-2021]WGT37725.1 hypothetical protein QH639_18065 [Lysinibacillus sp. 1 U-2021]